MKTTTKRVSIVVAVLAVATVIGYQALAAVSMAGQPTAVVSVNLSQVMEKLDQWADAAARLRKLKDELTKDQEARTAKLDGLKKAGETLQTEINGMADAVQKTTLEAKMQTLQEDAAMEALDFQAWMAFSTEKADIEAALATQDLYRSIKSAVAQMAGSNRFDVVIVDDSQGELAITADSRMSRVDQVRQQISTRRMLYVNPAIDITDDLIQRMNNARKTAGPKTP